MLYVRFGDNPSCLVLRLHVSRANKSFLFFKPVLQFQAVPRTSNANTEICVGVVGIPDALKGHLPFAFVTLSTAEHPESAIPDDKPFKEVQRSIREQIGAIAALGGMIQGKGMIPKTRSGKTLRRVLRELVENAVHGEFEKEVQVPATVEDAGVVEVARAKVKEYFQLKGADLHKATEERAKL